MRYQIVRDANGNVIAAISTELEPTGEGIAEQGTVQDTSLGFQVLAEDQDANEVTVPDEYRTLPPEQLLAKLRDDIETKGDPPRSA